MDTFGTIKTKIENTAIELSKKYSDEKVVKLINAVLALLPIGTILSFEPLPYTNIKPVVKSTSAKVKPTSSLTRTPVA